jgi:hypothetical protein
LLKEAADRRRLSSEIQELYANDNDWSHVMKLNTQSSLVQLLPESIKIMTKRPAPEIMPEQTPSKRRLLDVEI